MLDMKSWVLDTHPVKHALERSEGTRVILPSQGVGVLHLRWMLTLPSEGLDGVCLTASSPLISIRRRIAVRGILCGCCRSVPIVG